MTFVHHVLPVAGVVLLWWLGTGLVLYADGLPSSTFRWTFTVASLLGGLGLAGLAASSGWTEPAGAGVAFVSAFLVWGWLEASFYTGYLTGPRRGRCPDGCGGWSHLGHAIHASLWHELSMLVAIGLAWWLTRMGPNYVGIWTLCILFVAHQTARLNVLLGVRNVTFVFLPDHLHHLRDFVGPRSRRQPLLPLAVAGFTVGALVLAYRATVSSGFEATAFALLAATAGLAAAEHWALALPLRVERLWQWGLSSRAGR